jgi:hypothetical protein
MVNVMHSLMKSPGRTMALALALAPLGAAAARAQQSSAQPPARTHAHVVCVDGQCTEDSSRVIVVRLMDKVDSLQRIFLGRPITPEQRARMSEQMSDMIRQLTDLSQNAVAFGLQQAGEGMRIGLAAADSAMTQWQLSPRLAQDAAPKGWIGLTFVGAPLEDVHDGEYFVRFLDYPEVESVEPASPAQRAGIARGDLLMAFNGQDVTARAISMTRLLQPDRKIVVRLEHNGEPHDYSLVVAKAPRSYMLRMGDFSAPRAPAAPAEAPVMAAQPPTPPAPAPAPVTGFYRGGSTPAAAAAPSVSFFNFDSDRAPVAGAEMSTLNADLARNLNLGVDHGVMVISAPSGTPAAEAGLRSADIIVKVAGDDVASVRALRRALERHSADQIIELQIVREKRRQTLRINND